MASGVNLEEKSRVGVPKAVCRCTQPHSGNSCDVAAAKLEWPCCFFGSITEVERGGGGGGGGGGMLHGQQAVPHITLPRLTSIQVNLGPCFSLTPHSLSGGVSVIFLLLLPL